MSGYLDCNTIFNELSENFYEKSIFGRIKKKRDPTYTLPVINKYPF